MTITKDELEKQALALREDAKAVQVTTGEQFAAAGEFLKGVKRYLKGVDEVYDPILKRMRDDLDQTRKEKSDKAAPALEIESAIKRSMNGYLEDQKKKAEAERQRLEAEQKKKAEDERLALASQAEQLGEHEVAAEILNEEVYVPPVKMPAAVPKVDGIKQTTRWTAEVVDFGALIRAAAEDERLQGYLTPDMVAIRGLARSLKSKASIPGVKFSSETGISSGAS